VRPAGQLLVGFALQPRDGLLEAARAKLIRKGVDMIVANPLETMDSPTIEAIILTRSGSEHRTGGAGGGAITKEQFAPWLMDLIEQHLAAETQAQKQGS
jgi:phosphopantothenoylcysteine decarboxylase / phosphopantothenate---cysteine ligase